MCVFRVEVYRSTTKGECLSMVCYAKTFKHVWNVECFSKLIAECNDSEVFSVENQKWKMQLYSRGNDHVTKSTANYFSLYLALADSTTLALGTKIFSDFTLRVLDTSNNVLTSGKVLVLNEVDKLSREAQFSLKRTMEKYSATCRLILCCNSSSKVTEAVRSRCLNVRVNSPMEEEETSHVVSAPATLRSIPCEERSAPIAMEPVQAKEMAVAAVQPLSPYIVYEDLKPPSSPTPTPSTTSGSIKKSDLDTMPAALESTPLSEPANATIEEVTQADVKKTRPLSPYIFYDDLKPPTPPTGQKDLAIVDKDSVSEPITSDTQTSTPEMASEITETESVPDEVPKPRPLSPFMYDDLKPPTSPTPTPPVEKKDLIVVDAESKPSTSDTQTDTSEVTINIAEMVSVLEEVIKSRPLSPYAAYEDLKPPSSPSPTPSGPKEKPPTASTLPEDVPPLTGGNGIAETLVVTNVVETHPSQDLTHYLSAYYMYEDLKPPTTTMPSPKEGCSTSNSSYLMPR